MILNRCISVVVFLYPGYSQYCLSLLDTGTWQRVEFFLFSFSFFNVSVRKRTILFCFHWQIINTRIVLASCLGNFFFPWVIFWFTYCASEHFDHENQFRVNFHCHVSSIFSLLKIQNFKMQFSSHTK